MKFLAPIAAIVLITVLAWTGIKTGTQPASKSDTAVMSAAPASLPAASPGTVENAQTSNADPSAYKLSLIGTVVPDSQSSLTVRMPGRIVNVFVHLGEKVRKGQLLVQFDDSDSHTQVRTSESSVKSARIQIEKARLGKNAQILKLKMDQGTAEAGYMQAKQRLQQAVIARNAAKEDAGSDLKLAKDNFKKAQEAHSHALDSLQSLEKLAKVGGVSRSDLDAARLQESISRTDTNSARTQMNKLEAGSDKPPFEPYRVRLAEQDLEAARLAAAQSEKGVRAAASALKQGAEIADEDIRAAKIQAEQAESGYHGAVTQNNQSRLISPIDGIITSLNARPGETAQPGAPIITLVSSAGIHLEALISARHMPYVHLNLPAVVRVDTKPGMVYNAHVTFISSAAETDGRSFRVKLVFDKPVSIQPGISASISL